MFGLPIFRSGTKKPPREREDVLERFALQGEGGYAWNTFNFVDKDKMYVTRGFADSHYSSVIGGRPTNPAAYYTTYRYTTAIGGTTYYGLSGILRFCAGNSNNTAIFRDGRVFWSGNTKIHPWVRDNINQFKDLFMPSSYRANYVQLVLMQNGELRKLDLDYAAEENNPPIIVGTDNTSSPTTYKTLNDVTRIVAINQAHNADCIVACKDDSVWHVAIATTNFTPSGEYDARRIKNLKASEIQFAMIGDPGDSCFVVLKSEPRNLYRLTNSGRNLCDFGWLTERSLTPVNLSPFTYYGSSSTTLLEPDEQFIDGSSNEFHYTFLTNKHVHCFKAAQYGIGGCAYPGRAPVYVKHTLLPCQQPPIRMVTATSYAMAVELADGFYLLSSNGIANYDTGGNGGEYYKAYQKMERIENWTNLAKVLAPLRGLATFSKDCTPPPPETYALTRSAATVNEGNSVTFTLNTTNVPNGRTVPYVITGTGITTADIGGVPLTGDFTVSNNTASVTLNIAADLLTEGTETLMLTAEGQIASVIINDTSTTPPTYTLTRSVASVNEGSSVTFTMTTTDVANGTLVPYTITGVSTADIGGVSLTGNFIINNNTASVTLNITADATTEGTETLTMTSGGGYVSVTINDTSTTPVTPVPDPVLPEVTPEEIDYLTVSSASQGTRTKTVRDLYDNYGGMSNVSWISMCGGTGYGTSTGTVTLKFGPAYVQTVSGNGKGAALTIYNMYTMAGRLYGTIYKGTAGAQGNFNSTTDARKAVTNSLATTPVATNVDITDLPCTITASKGAASNPANVGTAVAHMRIRTKDRSKY